VQNATKAKKATSLGTLGFMIAAVIFAAVTGMLISQLMENKYSSDPVKPVVVAAGPIAAGHPLRKEDLRRSLWPQSAIPVGAFETVEALIASSRVPLIPFVKGEPILKSHLSESKSGIGIAPLIDKDHRAMSIRVDDPVALARLIYPGARVDVISTIHEQVGAKTRVIARTVIQNAKVLAVGEDIDPLTNNRRKKPAAPGSGGGLGMEGGGSGESREARGVVTLSLRPEEAERLSLASREGKIDLVLRSPMDTRTVATAGATPVALTGKESAPVAEAKTDPEPKEAVRPAPKRRPPRTGRVVARTGTKTGGAAPVVIFRGGGS
jgi:pilus assembly protein CpaB